VVTIEGISGLKELDAALSKLPVKVQGKTLVRALKPGARIILDEAVRRAPVYKPPVNVPGGPNIHGPPRRHKTPPPVPGRLKKNIKIRVGKSKTGKSVVIGVGRKWFEGPVWYGGVVEFGHKHGSRKRGANRKQVPGAHMVQGAFEAKAVQAVDAVIAALGPEIERAIKESREESGGKAS
jgi:hypothetical protein